MKMKRLGIGIGALTGVLLTAPLVAVMFAADQLLGLPFVPFMLFDWVSRVLPGPLVTFGIDMMIDTLRMMGASVAGVAKTAEQTIAVLHFLMIGVGASALFFAVLRLRGLQPSYLAALVAGALVGLPMIAITVAIGGSDVSPILIVLWLTALFLAWSAGLRFAYLRLSPAEGVAAGPDPAVAAVDGAGTADTAAEDAGMIGRRQFLIRMGAATATITVASTALGGLLSQAARRELEAELAATATHESQGSVRSPFPNAADRLMPAPGTRPEYTPLKDHYKVFIRTQPTVIDGATWTLPIVGVVANPLALTLDDLRNNYTAHDQYVTLSCISGRVGTDLISTTHWTGARLQDILADVKPDSSARYLHITSGDGFYETVDLDLIASDERIMLCYAWDGNPIPIDHGFPLRIWLPDRFGMKQPKWITGISVMEEYKEGYWVERGWDEVAQVQATSVVDAVAGDAAYESQGRMLVPVGGIAFAGARGISRVEVRVDGGPWQQAQLRAPLSETTWVIWRYDWPFAAGDHTFEVRCAEGDGTPQFEEARDNRPSGARGIHRKRAEL